MGLPGTNQQWAELIASVAKQVDEQIRSAVSQPALAAEKLTGPDLAQFIDHTLLKLDATEEQIDQLCDEAKHYNFKTVCVRLNYVPRAIVNLESSSTAVCCVIGFHEGTYPQDVKATEAVAALGAGARELDFVINRTQLATRQYQAVASELLALRILMPPASTAKIILETSQLQPAEIIAACVLAYFAGFEFVKTSTGFLGRGASVDDVKLMRAAADVLESREAVEQPSRRMKVKASGGIRTLEDAVKMIDAGAERLGVSAGVAIVEGAKAAAGDGY